MSSSRSASFGYDRFSSLDAALTMRGFWSIQPYRGGYALGGSKITLGYQELFGIGRVLPEIHKGFFQDCSTTHLSDEEGGGFLVGP